MPTTRRDRRHEIRLRRGRRLWSFLARVVPTRLGERGATPVHELIFQRLDLRAGQSVIDIGCGAGGTLLALREVVGPAGRLVGVDYSEGMLARARERMAERGWTNVELHRADASREPIGAEEFDYAVALASFSAMPDVAAAVDRARDALRPGGQLFVFDMRLLPSGSVSRRAVTRLLRAAYRALAGFSGADVVAELRRAFDTVDPALADRIGTMVALAVATKGGTSGSAGTARSARVAPDVDDDPMRAAGAPRAGTGLPSPS